MLLTRENIDWKAICDKGMTRGASIARCVRNHARNCVRFEFRELAAILHPMQHWAHESWWWWCNIAAKFLVKIDPQWRFLTTPSWIANHDETSLMIVTLASRFHHGEDEDEWNFTIKAGKNLRMACLCRSSFAPLATVPPGTRCQEQSHMLGRKRLEVLPWNILPCSTEVHLRQRQQVLPWSTLACSIGVHL